MDKKHCPYCGFRAGSGYDKLDSSGQWYHSYCYATRREKTLEAFT